MQGFVAECYVVYQDPTFDIGRTDRCRTQGSTCVLDGLSCYDEPKGDMAARVIAMTAETITHYISGKQRYYVCICHKSSPTVCYST